MTEIKLKRYVVEVRPPAEGESYLWRGGPQVAQFDFKHDQAVIVGEQ